MRGAPIVVFILILGATALVAPQSARASPSLPVLDVERGSSSPSPTPRDAPFGPNVRVSEVDTPGNQNEITLAVAPDGRIHMAWNDLRQPNPDYRCGYAYSVDGGQSWSANQLFHLPGWEADGDPVLVVDGTGAVYLICMPFNRSNFNSRIVVYKSTDGGATWAAPVIASDTTSGLNDKPWAHVAGSTIHLCYANFGISPNELRYTRSFDGGVTWEPTRVLDRGGNGCAFAHTTGSLVLAWARGGAIYAFRSTDGGTTWSGARFIGAAPFTSAGDQRAGPLPSLAGDIASENVYAVWTADDALGFWDVRFSRSTDGGFTWASVTTVNDVSADRQFMPWIDVGGDGTVHVTWYDRRSGLMAVRYASSSDAGATWSASTRVTDTEWASTYFVGDYIALDVDGAGKVNAGWCDRRSGENEAYFARAVGAGPPRLSRIDIVPTEAWTDADTPVSFTAAGYDQYGQSYPLNPTWEATGGTVSFGVYVPERAGDWVVWANESGISGSAVVHVAPGALARIDVSPPDVTLSADDVQQYAAIGYDAKGNPVSVTPAWGVSDGAIDSTGLFTPRRVGAWTVNANASGVSGSTSVTVTPGALAAVTVSPPTASITADDVLQYTAIGHDAKGNEAPIAPLWSAAGGTIDSAGLYVARRVGTWTVYANASGLSGSAQVTVAPGALAVIDVTPKDAVVTADQTVQYTATGSDEDGNDVAIAPAWSVAAGTIDPTGLYTPGPVGTHVVTASAGSVSGTTGVIVRPGPLARIDVIPAIATITADDVLQLTAQGFDIRGNRVGIAPAWAASCGAVDGTGLYTGGPAALCIVYASEAGIAGAAAITVVPGRLARIDMDPPVAAITADEAIRFTAKGYDAKGNEVPVAPAWSVPEGAIDASGVYVPRLVGTWQVRATVSPISGTASVTVAPGALAVIDVVPAVTTVRADRTLQFAATGRDGKGNDVLLDQLTWFVGDGTIAAGLYEPQTVGLWTVSAMHSGRTGTARVTVVPGAIARVELAPGTARVPEGGSVTFSATAYDGKGNVVPDAELAWRVEGAIGIVDGTGHFTGASPGRGRVVVTAEDGEATMSAGATVVVDRDWSASLAWGFFAALASIPLLVAFLWRRRRAPPPPTG